MNVSILNHLINFHKILYGYVILEAISTLYFLISYNMMDVQMFEIRVILEPLNLLY